MGLWETRRITVWERVKIKAKVKTKTQQEDQIHTHNDVLLPRYCKIWNMFPNYIDFDRYSLEKGKIHRWKE